MKLKRTVPAILFLVLINASPGFSQTPEVTPAVVLPGGQTEVFRGETFTVQIKVGENLSVSNLYGVSFVLTYDNTSFVTALEATAGDFLGTGAIIYANLDTPGEAAIAVTATSGTGSNGTGLVAEVTFQISPGISSGPQTVVFQITDIVAVDPNGTDITLSGTGATEDLTVCDRLSISTLSLGFGDVPQNVNNSQSFTITNNGTAGIGITNISSNSGLYTVSPSTFPVSLSGGDKLSFTVTFNTADAATYNATITIDNDDPNELPLTVSVSGQGSGATLTALQWTFITGSGIQYSAPAVSPADGTVYTGSDDGFLYALYPGGTLKWKFLAEAGQMIRSSPALAANQDIYFGCSNGKVYGVNISGFAVAAPYDLAAGEITASPAIGEDGTIYVAATDKVAALSLNLSLQWTRTITGTVAEGPSIGPNGTVYVGASGGTPSLYALSPTDGSDVFTPFAATGNIKSSPAIGSDGTIYFTTESGKVYAVNSDGTQKWQAEPNPGDTFVNSSPTIGTDGTIYVGFFSAKKVYALNPADGTTVWSTVALNPLTGVAPLVTGDDKLHFGSETVSSFYTLNTSDGSINREITGTPAFRSPPAISSDGSTLYIGATDGKLLAFSNITGGAGLADTPWPKFGRDSKNSGLSQAAGIQLSVSAVAIGSVPQGSIGNKAFSIANGNDFQVQVSSITSSSSSFTVYPTGSLYIPPNNSAFVTVSYISSGAGSESATITVNSDDPNNPSVTLTATGSGIAPDPRLDWTFETDGAINLSSFAIGPGDTYYIGSSDGFLYVLRSDGTLKWRYSLGNQPVRSSPAVGPDGSVYVGSDDYYLYAFDPYGSFKWNFPTSDKIVSSPAVGVDGTVYVGSLDNTLYAISPNGNRNWTYNTGGQITSSPAVGRDGTVYFGSDDFNLYAIYSNGFLKWSYATGGAIKSSPAIGPDGTIYVGSGDGFLHAVDPVTGLAIWTTLLPNGVITTSSPVVGPGGIIYAGSDLSSTDGYLYAYNPDGSLLWNYNPSTPISSTPVITYDETVYFGGENGWFYALDQTGSVEWSHQTGGAINSSATISMDGLTVLAGSQDNKIYAFHTVADPTLGDKKLALSSWPKFHGNPQNSGLRMMTPGDLAWEYSAAPGEFSLGSPAIDSIGVLYLTTYTDGVLHAVNPDGTPRWTFNQAPFYSQPAIGEVNGVETIYVGDAGGILHAINPWPAPSLLWSYNTNTGQPIEGPPAIDELGLVIVGTQTGVICIDPAGAPDQTSMLKWSYTTAAPVKRGPVIAGHGTIYAVSSGGTGNSFLYALDIADGALVWPQAFQAAAEIFSAPAVSEDGTVFFGCANNIFYAVNPDGTQRWQHTGAPGENFLGNSPSISMDGNVYIGHTLGSVLSLEVENGNPSVFFSLPDGTGVTSCPAIGRDGTFYLGSSGDDLYAVSPSSQLLWSFHLPGTVNGYPAISRDGTKVYVTVENGTLYAFDTGAPPVGPMLATAGMPPPDGLEEGPWPKYRADFKNSGTVRFAKGPPPIVYQPDPFEIVNVPVEGNRSEIMTLINNGDLDFVASQISTNNPQFTVSPATGTIPAFGGVLELSVTFFAPQAPGRYSGQIILDPVSQDMPPIFIPVDGFAVTAGTAPEIEVMPGQLFLGDIQLGGANTVPLNISNYGSSDLFVSNISSDNPEFTITNPGDPSRSTANMSPPLTIPPGQGMGFMVTFTPSAVGPRTATITINSSDSDEGTVSLPASGRGVDPEIDIQGLPTLSIAFGDVNILDGVTQAFTISNQGNAPLIISISSTNPLFMADPPIFWLFPDQAVIDPNNSLEITVAFSPPGPGQVNASFTINSNDRDEGTITVNVSGSGATPEISLDRNNFSFGDVDVGQSASGTFNIRNNGSGTLEVISIESDNERFGVSPSSGVVDPGDGMSVTIIFKPLAPGEQNGSITILSSDPGNPEIHVFADGNGVGAAAEPRITLSIETISIENVPVGGTADKNFTIANSGGEDLVVSEISVTPDPGPFSLSHSSGAIPGGGALDVTLTYSPTTDGPHNATVTIKSNDPEKGELTVSVSGTTAVPQVPDISVAPLFFDFGEVPVGGSAFIDIVIESKGTAPLGLGPVTLSAPPEFRITFDDASNSSIPPGESRTVRVSLAPQTDGPRSATLTIISDDPDMPSVDVAINGKAVVQVIVAPDIALSIESFDFGSVKVNQTVSHSFEIANTGNAPLMGIAIGTTNPSFMPAPGMVPSLPEGGSVTIMITFTPKVAGPQSAEIIVSSPDPDEPELRINVTGSGVSEEPLPVTDYPPVFDPPPLQHFFVEPGVPAGFPVNATDPEGLTVEYSTSPLPPFITFDPVTGFLDINAAPEHAGQVFTIDITASDPSGKTNVVSVTIEVGQLNLPPFFDPPLPPEVFPVDPGVPMGFQLHATDPEGGHVTYRLLSPPPPNSSFDRNSGQFTINASPEQGGQVYELVFEAADPEGNPSPQIIVTLEVIAENQPPSVEVSAKDITINQGETASFTFSVLDPDQDPATPLVVEVFGDPFGLQAPAPVPAYTIAPDGRSGDFQWTTDENVLGFFVVTVRVVDDKGAIDEKQVGITVNSTTVIVNKPPRLDPIADITKVSDGTPLDFTIHAIDDPEDEIRYTMRNAPPGAILDPVTGAFHFEAPMGFVGEFFVTFRASDGSLADEIEIRMSFGAQQQPPEILSLPAVLTVKPGDIKSFVINTFDPNGDKVFIILPDPLPPGAFFDPLSRMFTFSPSIEQAGEVYIILVNAEDEGGLQAVNPTEVQLVVEAPNRPPEVIVDFPPQVDAGAPVSFTFTVNDPDGDPLVITFETGPFPFTPTIDQTGPGQYQGRIDIPALPPGNHPFIIIADDQRGEIMKAPVFITVGDVNRPPLLDPIGDQNVEEGTVLTFTVTASDIDGDPVAVTATPPLPGAAFLWDPAAGSGVYTLTPLEGAREYFVTFTASDGKMPVSETVRITVTAIARPPELFPVGNRIVKVGDKLIIQITAIPGTKGEAVALSLTGEIPPHSTFDPDNGRFTFEPTFDDVRIYTLTVTATSPSGSVFEVFTITVEADNRAPYFVEIIPNKDVEAGGIVEFVAQAEDLDADDQVVMNAIGAPMDLFNATFNPETGKFFWLTPADISGNFGVLFTAVDLRGGRAEMPVNITVGAANRPPEISFIEGRQVDVGMEVIIVFTASDPDGDPLTIRLGNRPPAAILSFDPATGDGSFSWTPGPAEAGLWEMELTVNDGKLTARQHFPIDVKAMNNPPRIDPLGDHQVTVGGQVSFTVTVFDEEPVILTVSPFPLPDGMEFRPMDGFFMFKPGFEYAGQIFSLEFTATDPAGAFVTEPVNIEVKGVNRPPRFDVLLPQTIEAGKLIEIVLPITEEDNDLLTFEYNIPGGASFDETTLKFSWTPSDADAGTHQVTFTVDDGKPGGRITRGFTITVTRPDIKINQPPMILPIGPRMVESGKSLFFTVEASDPDNPSFMLTATGMPANAEFAVSPGIPPAEGGVAVTGELTFAPTHEQAGKDYTVSFSASDGNVATDIDVTISVFRQENTAPGITGVADIEVTAGTLVQFTVTAVDVEGDDYTLMNAKFPAGASFVPATGTFTFQTTEGVSETAEIEFTATDDLGASSSAAMILTATAENRPPKFTRMKSIAAEVDAPFDFTVEAIELDKGDVLTYSSPNAAGLGATFDPATRMLSWTPTDPGIFDILFLVEDGKGGQDETPVTVTVSSPTVRINQPPVFDDIQPQVVKAGQTELKFTVHATDVENDAAGIPLEYGILNKPDNSTLDPETREFTLTPADDQRGQTFNPTFTVTDGQLFDEFEVGILLEAVNREPEINPIGDRTVPEGEELNFFIIGNDQDPGDVVTLSATGVPENAGFYSASGLFSFTPATGQAAAGAGNPYTVTASATDQQATVTQDFTITVTAVNQAPKLGFIDNQDKLAGEFIELVVTAEDPNDPLSALEFSATGLPAGASFSETGRVFKWTPAPDQIGVFRVTFTVEDPGGLSDERTIKITVDDPTRNINKAPKLATIGSKTARVGETLSFEVTATDPDQGDVLTLSAPNLPTGANFTSSPAPDNVSGAFSWTPSPSQGGKTHSLAFSVSDGDVVDEEPVEITVTQQDVLPWIEGVADQEVKVGEEVVFIVQGRDDGGENVNLFCDKKPGGANFDQNSGRFSWTPPASQAGKTVEVIFRAADASGNAVTESMNISVAQAENSPPVFRYTANMQVESGKILNFVVRADDDDKLTYSATGIADIDDIFNKSNGQFHWQPTDNDIGNHEVAFTAEDPEGLKDNMAVMITVTDPLGAAVNQPPSISASPAGAKTVKENVQLTFTITATDPDGSISSLTAENLPAGANFSATGASGTFTWTPGFTDQGSHRVTFKATDDGSLETSFPVDITVQDENLPPTLEILGGVLLATAGMEFKFTGEGLTLAADEVVNFTAAEGIKIVIHFIAGDPGGDLLGINVRNMPRGMSFDRENKNIAWTPDFDQASADAYLVRIEVSDGKYTVRKSASITVAETNRDPVLRPIGERYVNDGSFISFEINAYDPDDDAMEFEFTGIPGAATLDNNQFTFDTRKLPSGQQADAVLFTFRAFDKDRITGVRKGGMDEQQNNIAIIRAETHNFDETGALLAAEGIGSGGKFEIPQAEGIGMSISISNTTSLPATPEGKLDWSEISGPISKEVAEKLNLGREFTLLAGADGQAFGSGGKRKASSSGTATIRLADGGETSFTSIRRGWGLDLTSFTLATSLASDSTTITDSLNVNITVAFQDSDKVVTPPEGLSVPSLLSSLVPAAWDSATGQFVSLPGTVDTTNNLATFSINLLSFMFPPDTTQPSPVYVLDSLIRLDSLGLLDSLGRIALDSLETVLVDTTATVDTTFAFLAAESTEPIQSALQTEYKPYYKLFTLGLVKDITAPTIITSPKGLTTKNTGPYSITALVTDDLIGIESVTMSYEVGGILETIPMEEKTGSRYEGIIPAQEPGAMVKYYVEATDKHGNLARDPDFLSYLITINDREKADLDGNGSINIFDLLALLKAWQTGDLSGDINGDSQTDIWDILTMMFTLSSQENGNAQLAAETSLEALDSQLEADAGEKKESPDYPETFGISVESRQPVSAVQMVFSLAEEVEIGNVILLAGDPTVKMMERIDDRKLTILVFNLSGNPLPLKDKLLEVSCRISGDKPLTDKMITVESCSMGNFSDGVAAVEGLVLLDGVAPLPKAFSLSQNYPNPFNPSTTVSYSIPDGQDELSVSLRIYNLRGQLIKVLVDEVKKSGSYSVDWDGKDSHGRMAASGVYFYRINAGNFVKTRKMVLLK